MDDDDPVLEFYKHAKEITGAIASMVQDETGQKVKTVVLIVKFERDIPGDPNVGLAAGGQVQKPEDIITLLESATTAARRALRKSRTPDESGGTPRTH